MRHTMNDLGWKGIMVEYDRVNQWRIHNLKTKKMHFSAFVRFD